MQDEDFKYFKENHEDLLKVYPNKYLVIKDKKILFFEDTFEEALTKAIDGGHDVGSFIIQLCSAGEGGYTQTFHSRVIFA